MQTTYWVIANQARTLFVARPDQITRRTPNLATANLFESVTLANQYLREARRHLSEVSPNAEAQAAVFFAQASITPVTLTLGIVQNPNKPGGYVS